jgi:hypothetical protein
MRCQDVTLRQLAEAALQRTIVLRWTIVFLGGASDVPSGQCRQDRSPAREGQMLQQVLQRERMSSRRTSFARNHDETFGQVLNGSLAMRNGKGPD